jgi:DNA-3-methyladenine glycosylase
MAEMPIVANPASVDDPIPAEVVLGWPILPRKFYARPVVEVARAVLGTVLLHGGRAGRIVEVEAYLGQDDRAAHAWHGRTVRTEVLFGPPGHAYVYLIYGMHECLNLVAEPEGRPGCVLVRALEPVSGLEEMRKARRHAVAVEKLCSGPGNLTRAMAITRQHYGADLTAGPLTIHRTPKRIRTDEIGVSGRIGIEHGKELPLRFYLKQNKSVSGPRG